MNTLVHTTLRVSSTLYTLIFLGLTLAFTPDARSQCNLSGPPQINVNLSAACMDQLTLMSLQVSTSNCLGPFTIEIMENGMSLGDIITADMIGNTYMVIVEDGASGNMHMTQILVLDKQAPSVMCPDDVTLECTADIEAYVGMTTDDVEDCSPVSILVDDELISSGNCVGNIISVYRRTYTIVDIYNNATTCEQTISLEKADLEDVVFPDDITLSCFPVPDTSPDGPPGYPTVDGNPIINGTFCNLTAIYIDIPIPVCSGSMKFNRVWTVTDWCAGNESTTATQFIEVLDETGPVVDAPADMTISTGSVNCTASTILPPAGISEDCSSMWTVQTNGPFPTIQGNGGPVAGLPEGVHKIIYFAINDCGKIGKDSMYLTVQDLQPPAPVCRQNLVIPVNNEGITLIPAHVFDQASGDNCGDVYFKVRRMSLPNGYTCENPGNPDNRFDDFIQFCCEDIEHNNIMVVLRVYDVPVIPGPVDENYLAGHFNDCMVQVEVQDKLPPQIICPTNLTISCEFPFTVNNLDVFGTVVLDEADREQICIDDPGAPGNPGLQCVGLDGLATDNCNVAVSETHVLNVNNCGTGTLVRTFTATDDGLLHATCQQVITIVNYDLFDESQITWPDDYTAFNVCDVAQFDTANLNFPYKEPILADGPCDLVTFNYEDMVFQFSPGDEACFKILRTWTVVDWCQVNSTSGWTWTHTQILKAMNSVVPEIEPVADREECSFDPECGGLTLEFEASATDDCSSAAALRWRYYIDFDNDNSLEVTSTIQYGGTVAFSRYMPLGTHRVLYTVWDQCGNSATEEQLVTVESCKTPSAVCIHGLSANLMEMDTDGDGTGDWGMVQLRPEMFDASSYHPCGNPITLAFSEEVTHVTEIFDCSQLGHQPIELWVIDNNGLMDVCTTFVIIQDNSDVCPEMGGLGTISGKLKVPGAGTLGGAMVYLDGSSFPGTPSNGDGYFVFPPMTFGGSYTVRPERSGDARNGVTTLDLVRIQKYLLGIGDLSSPYQYIAADANNSKSVTAIDIVELRKLILGYYDELPNNKSWRFVDEAHVFPDPHDPWVSLFPETYQIQPFESNMNAVNFNSIKIGDLNGSAILQTNGGQILPRTDRQALVSYTIQPDIEKDIYKVELVLNEASDFEAVQFSFNWDYYGYELLDWTPGASFQAEDFRMPANLQETGSVAVFSSGGWATEQVALLTFWVKKTTVARNFSLFIAQGPTTACSYQIDDSAPFGVTLKQERTAEGQILNKPNPFKDMTLITLNSPHEEPAVLRIYDMNGRLAVKRSVTLLQGENEFVVRRNELPGQGIYKYEIESDLHFYTNRMIIVD